MKDYALIAQFTALKGFFKKTAAGEYLVVAVKDNKKGNCLLFQFLGEVKPGLYVVSILGVVESPDDDVLEENLDGLRYHGQVKILEDKLASTIEYKNKISVKFKKPSKYLGSSILLSNDSRLEPGLMMAEVKVKSGFEPVQQYKIGAGVAGDNATIKKIRAFSSSRLGTLMKRKN